MAKILITDDDPALRSVYTTICQKNGWTVVTAENGKEALAIIDSENPDAVIMDVLMPIMGGIDFLKAYYKHERAETPAIIMLTNSQVPADTENNAKSLGASEYRRKSDLKPSELAELIKKYLKE